MKKVLLMISGLIVAGCTAGPPPSPTPPPGPTPTATAVSESGSSSKPTPAELAVETLDHARLMNQLLFEVSSRDEGLDLLKQIEESGDTQFVAALVDTLRYQRGLREDIAATLNALTGQDLPAGWFNWVEWAGNHPEIESFAGYPAWKGNLFAQIDPNFRRFVYDNMRIAPDSRVEEILWGGVVVDGIPALDNPTMVDPDQAAYLVPEERVFGVSINGDTRAYPARFLDWHEMFNDVVGGEPVSLAY